MSKRVRLETWLRDTYGADAPGIATARRWCRAGKILPAPERHGRCYFVSPDARYTDRPPQGKPRLIDRVLADRAKAQAG